MVKETTKTEKAEKEVSFSGKYIRAVGRRKTSVAEVRLYEKGKGAIVINGKKASEYFPANILPILSQPLKLTGQLKDFNFSIKVMGGGPKGQVEAIRHGITRALIKFDAELRPALKVKGYVTRDARKVERKKPGLKKARRSPQWSKR